MRISDWSSDVCSSDLLPDLEFCRWLTIEHGVATIPLSPFYADPPPGQRLARLCFAKSEPTLDAAIERLRRLRSEERRVGKSVSVRVDLGGRRIIKKKNKNEHVDEKLNIDIIEK